HPHPPTPAGAAELERTRVDDLLGAAGRGPDLELPAILAGPGDDATALVPTHPPPAEEVGQLAQRHPGMDVVELALRHLHSLGRGCEVIDDLIAAPLGPGARAGGSRGRVLAFVFVRGPLSHTPRPAASDRQHGNSDNHTEAPHCSPPLRRTGIG